MKKHYLIVGAACFLGLAAGIYSCSQEMDPSITNETAVNRAALRARKFFESGAGSLSLPDTYFKENGVSPGTRASEARSLLSDAIEPDWLGARVWENEEMIVTEVPALLTRPVSYTVLIEERGDTVSLITQAPHTRIRVVERFDIDTTFCFLITMLPDMSYEGDLSQLAVNPEGSDYSGITIYSLVDGTPAWGWRYRSGEIVNSLLFDDGYADESDPNVQIRMGINPGAVTRAWDTWVDSNGNIVEFWIETIVVVGGTHTSQEPLIPPGWGLGGPPPDSDEWDIPVGGGGNGSHDNPTSQWYRHLTVEVPQNCCVLGSVASALQIKFGYRAADAMERAEAAFLARDINPWPPEGALGISVGMTQLALILRSIGLLPIGGVNPPVVIMSRHFDANGWGLGLSTSGTGHLVLLTAFDPSSNTFTYYDATYGGIGTGSRGDYQVIIFN